jgi:hypothetical protein
MVVDGIYLPEEDLEQAKGVRLPDPEAPTPRPADLPSLLEVTPGQKNLDNFDTTLGLALEQNADQVAQARDLFGEASGWTASEIQTEADRIEVMRLSMMAERMPGVQEWMRAGDNAALAQDSVEQLGVIEKSVDAIKRWGMGLFNAATARTPDEAQQHLKDSGIWSNTKSIGEALYETTAIPTLLSVGEAARNILSAQTPEEASKAIDDALGPVDDAAEAFGKDALGLFSDVVGAKTPEEGKDRLTKALMRGGLAVTTGIGEGLASTRFGLVGHEIAMYGSTEEREAYLQRQREIIRNTGGKPEGFLDFLKQSSYLVGNMALGFERSIKASLAGGAVTAALGAMFPAPEEIVTVPLAMKAFGAAEMARFAYEVEGGHTYIALRDIAKEEGLEFDDETAKNLMHAVGLINSGLELAGLAMIAKPYQMAVKKMAKDGTRGLLRTKTGRQALVNFAKNYFKAIAGETGTEVAQEIPQMAASEIYRRVQGLDPKLTLEEAAQQMLEISEKVGKGMVLMALPGAGLNLAYDARDARRAKNSAAHFKRIIDASKKENNPLHERSPDAFSDAVKTLTQGSPIQDIGFPFEAWDAYWSDIAQGDEAVMQALYEEMGVADQVAEARENPAADIVMPAEDVLTKMGGTHIDRLYQNMRFGLDTPTLNELVAWEEFKEQHLKSALEEADRVSAEIAASAEPIEAVRQAFTRMATEAGRDQVEAESIGALAAARAEAMMERSAQAGVAVDPSEVYLGSESRLRTTIREVAPLPPGATPQEAEGRIEPSPPPDAAPTPGESGIPIPAPGEETQFEQSASAKTVDVPPADRGLSTSRPEFRAIKDPSPQELAGFLSRERRQDRLGNFDPDMLRGVQTPDGSVYVFSASHAIHRDMIDYLIQEGVITHQSDATEFFLRRDGDKFEMFHNFSGEARVTPVLEALTRTQTLQQIPAGPVSTDPEVIRATEQLRDVEARLREAEKIEVDYLDAQEAPASRRQAPVALPEGVDPTNLEKRVQALREEARVANERVTEAMQAAQAKAPVTLQQVDVPLTKPGGTIQPTHTAPTPEQVNEAKADTRVGMNIVRERMNAIIPEETRVLDGEYTVGPPTGDLWSDLKLDTPGPGFRGTQADLDRMYAEAVEESSQAAKDAVAETGMRFVLTPEQLDRAMRLPLMAQLWYELSGEKFRDKLAPGQISIRQFLTFADLIGATSSRSQPRDNLRRALAILSQYIQGVPIDIDLSQPTSVRNALQRGGVDISNLDGNKTGMFSNTVALTAGATTEFPIPVNDVWVGRMFGITDKQLTANQSLHETMALFQIKLRDFVNDTTADQLVPHQSWHVQARTWVDMRPTEEANDYAAEWNSVIEDLKAAGVPGIQGDVITMEALMSPAFAPALRRTLTDFRAAPKATIEFGTTQNQTGARAFELYNMAREAGDALTQKEYLQTITSAMFDSGRGDRTVWEALIRAITGEAINVTRIEGPTSKDPFAVSGTFEGNLSPNIRIPMFGSKQVDGKRVVRHLTLQEIQMFDAIVGRALKQDAMAVSHVIYDPTGPTPEGYIPNFSIYIPTTETLDSSVLTGFSDALPDGHGTTIHRDPGGYVIDITTAFTDEGEIAISHEDLDAAIEASGLADRAQVMGVDYWSTDYREAPDYDSIVAENEERIDAETIEDFIKRGVEPELAEQLVKAYHPSAVLGQVPSRAKGRARTAAKNLVKRRADLADAEARIVEFRDKVDQAQQKNIEKWERRLGKAGVDTTTRIETLAQPETQTLQQPAPEVTQSPEFQERFAGSQVVNEDGSPQVVYHGTSVEIDRFREGEGPYRGGIIGFVTTDPKFASGYAGSGAGAQVLPLYLRAEAPFDYRTDAWLAEAFYDDTGGISDPVEVARILAGAGVDVGDNIFDGRDPSELSAEMFREQVEKGSWDAIEADEFVEYLRESGYDAVITMENGAINYGFFEHDQVISAITGQTLQQPAPEVTQSPEFQERFAGSQVVNADGSPRAVFHSSPEQVEGAFRPLSHFGSAQAAEDRIIGLTRFSESIGRDPGTPQTIPVYLDIKNPLRLPDMASIYEDRMTGEVFRLPEDVEIIEQREAEMEMDDEALGHEGPSIWPRQWGGEEDVSSTLLEEGIIDGDEFESARHFGPELVEILKSKGYDGIVYENVVEDAGSDSYIIFDSDQVISAITGQTLAQEELPSGSRAQVTFTEQGALIELFRGRADPTSLFHELMHVFRRDLEMLAGRGVQQAADDLEILRKWVGAETGETLTRKQEELIADGWEIYLQEGKAPSVELAGVFDRFKAWFLRVYRSIKPVLDRNGVELNDEVRAVFDRLLATDEQIAEAEAVGRFEPIFRGVADDALTTAERKSMQTTLDAARAASKSDLLQKKMREIKRLRAQEKLAAYKVVEEQVAEEFKQEPRYEALFALAAGTDVDGIPLMEPVKLDREILRTRYPDVTLNAYGRIGNDLDSRIYAENGVDPNDIADVFGYANGDALVQDLIGLKSFNTAVGEEARARFKPQEREFAATEGELVNEAMDSVHGDERLKYMAIEYRALSRKAGIDTPGVVQAAKNVAAEIINRRTVNDAVKASAFLRAERAAAAAAHNAVVKGDYQEAINQQQRRILQHALYMEARRAEREIQKDQRTIANLKTKGARRRIEAGHLDQIHQLFERYDLRARDPDAPRRKILAQWVKEKMEDGFSITLPEELIEDTSQKHWRQVPLGEWRAFMESIRHIEYLGRRWQKLADAREQRLFEDIRDDMVSTIYANRAVRPEVWEFGKTVKPGDTSGLKRFWQGGLTIDLMMETLDGFKPGPMQKYIIRRMAEANDHETRLQRETARKLAPLWNLYSKVERAKWNGVFDRVYVPAFGPGKAFHKLELIMIALNAGNPEGREALLAGRNWTEEQLDAILIGDDSEGRPVLDQRDWQFITGIWKIFEEMRPDLFAFHKEMTGVDPKPVEALPIMTRFGEIAGGYFPIIYDSGKSWVAEQHDKEKDLQSLFGFNHVYAATQQGHFKSRTQRLKQFGQVVPLKIDIHTIPTHFADVIHDRTHRAAVIDVMRFIKDPLVGRAILETMGPEAYAELVPWVQRIAGEKRMGTPGERFIRMLNNNASINLLGHSLMVAFVQPVGITNAIPNLDVPGDSGSGLRWLGVGADQYRQHPAMAFRFMWENSEFMQARLTNRERDVRQIVDNMGPRGVVRSVRDTAFHLIGAMDFAISTIIWTAAYQRAWHLQQEQLRARARAGENVNNTDLQELHKAAIFEADMVVRRSQGTGEVFMLNRHRGTRNEFWNAMTKFMSYWQGFTTNMVRSGRMAASNLISKPQYAAHLLWMLFLPALVEGYMRGGPDEEEDEHFGWWYAKQVGLHITGGMPIVRDISRAYFDRYDVSTPTFDAMTTFGLAPRDLTDLALDEDKDALTRSEVRRIFIMSGYLLGAPGNQAWRLYDAWVAEMENKGATGLEPLGEGSFYKNVVRGRRVNQE